ncbi:diguanylate cyclase domain-containing protein [Silvibacterium sp.]|uniref:diguanylate cyclase domain-containing protein n=1 Tax=Silvibacterium sp. TaxID=1964179 RepID=UPI0039E614DC
MVSLLASLPSRMSAASLLWPLGISMAMVNTVCAVLLLISLGAAIYAIRMRIRARTLQRAIGDEVARQTRESLIERERSRILEAIGNTLPLPQVLALIVNFISEQRRGLRCWCILRRGATVPSASAGTLEYPGDDVEQFRYDIHTADEEWLGAFLLEGHPSPDDSELLRMGTDLAMLAIQNRQMQEALIHRTEHDPLTDLPNRLLFERRVAQAMAAAERHTYGFALIYIDLDHFKRVNDRYGHHIGDLYLRTVARRLSERLRRRDTLGRVGGDEFLALITQVYERAEVEEVVQRLADAFTSPFPLQEFLLTGTASFGIALFPHDGASLQQLEVAADAAMYASKRATRSRSVEVKESSHGLRHFHPHAPVPQGKVDA